MVVCLAAVAAVACVEVKPKGGVTPGPEPWPFAPTALRLHPFTSLTTDPETGRTMIEAHVELLDALSDNTKGLGTFRFELHQVDRDATFDPVRDPLVMKWVRRVSDLEAHGRHFDPFTRTYRFKLEVDEPTQLDQDKSQRLVANLLTDQGRQLTTQTTVDRKAAEQSE